MDDFKNNAKNFIKNKAKNFIEKKLKMKMMKIKIIIFLILAIFLVCFMYFLDIFNGVFKEDDMSNVPYAVSTYTKSVKFDNNGITFDMTPQEIWDAVIEEGFDIEQYLDKPEELEKLMNAEIITQYPKFGLGNGKIDGIIEFERHEDDGTITKLKYIDNEVFNNKIETNDIDSFNYIKHCYTIDESGNVQIAVLDTTTTSVISNDPEVEEIDNVEYNICSKSINYKSVVEKYTMPFQYLWALLVITNDKDFVLELADLVYDSEITISIYDNITTTENTEINTYDKEVKTETKANVEPAIDYGVVGYKTSGEDTDVETISCKVERTTIYKENTPIIDLTKANTWIIDYSKEYMYQANKQESESNNSSILDDEDYQDNGNKNSNQDSSLLNNRYALELRDECKRDILKQIVFHDYAPEDTTTDVIVNVTYVECKSFIRKINQKTETITKTSSQKYEAGNVVNKIKDDKNAQEESFVTMLCSAEHMGVKKLLVSGAEWLFEILEKNEDTANMVDLTKYLLYKATGNDYGVTEYDYSEYEDISFSDIKGIYGGTLQEKVWFALKDLGFCDEVIAGAMGNIDLESGGFSATAVESGGTGIGLIQWSYGRAEQLKRYASSKGVKWTDEDTQIEFLIAEISGKGPASKMAVQRTSGYIGDERIRSTYTQWKNAKNIEEATLYFMRYFESPARKETYDNNGTWRRIKIS